MIIRVDKPTLRRKDMDAVLQTMADEQIGPGEHARAFESMFNQYLKLEGTTIALRTHADAIDIAVRALGLPVGSTIAVSALTPFAHEHVITRCGHQVLIVDIDEEHGILDLDQVPLTGQHKVAAILLYEPYGNIPQDPLWNELDIPIIEDISESLGSAYGERSSGEIGDIVICSFEESSMVSTAGGSIVHAREAEVGERLQSLLEPLSLYIGMPDMNAALGCVQFEHVQRNLALRQAVRDRFRQALMRTRHQLFGIQDIEFSSNGQAFVVILDAKPADARQFALRYDVDTEMAFPKTVIAGLTDRFDLYPHAIPCVLRGLRFPLYPFLSSQQVSQIERVISHLP